MACEQCGSAVSDCGCEGVQAPFINGRAGLNGLSPYELWLAAGNSGTVADYIDSITGEDGSSAYEVAVEQGFSGTIEEWLDSLVGAPGEDGDDGQDGVNAYGYAAAQSPMPQMPVANALASILLLPTPGNQTQWPGLGQPIWVEGWGTMAMHANPIGDTIIVRNLGYAENAAAGTTLNVGAKVSPGGWKGIQGIQGPPGNTIPPDIPTFIGALPTEEPSLGQFTALWTNESLPDSPTFIIRWNGSSYDVGARISGAAGTRTLWINGNPNSQPSDYGADGWTAIDYSTPNLFVYYERVSPGSWTERGRLTGGVASGLFDMFRAGKTAAQPLPRGTTAETRLQFELSSGPGFYNGGWWNGSSYRAGSGVTTPMRFLLQGLRIYRNGGSGENIDFDVDILVKGSSSANATISITSADTEGILDVLSTADEAMDATSVVEVVITPSLNPTEQWFVDFADIAFYNQK